MASSKIFVPPNRLKTYTWIPRQPVMKTDSTFTTKIRLVFNCSLKTGNSVSMNESAYPRVNITGDMLKLLSFRIDDYVLLADIKKSFLMVCLELEELILLLPLGLAVLLPIFHHYFWVHFQSLHTELYTEVPCCPISL